MGSRGLKAPRHTQDAAELALANANEARWIAAAARAGGPASRLFARELAANVNPVGVLVMGDSTGNDADEWVRLLLERIAERHPERTVTHRLYNASAETWDAETVVQTAPGGEAYFQPADGTLGNYSVVDNPLIVPAGGFSARVKLRRDDWTNHGAQAEPFNKFGGAGQRSWRLTLWANGTMTFEHSPDGTALVASPVSLPVPFTPGQIGWIRADYIPDDGAGNRVTRYITSADGATWTQLGADHVVAGASSVFDSTAPLMVANRGGVSTGEAYYAADLYAGVGGAGVLVAAWRAGEMRRYEDAGWQSHGFDCRGNVWQANSAGVTTGIVGAPHLHVVNGSISGASIAGFEGHARMSQMLGQRSSLALVNLGHNGSAAGVHASYRARLSALVAEVTNAWPECAVVFTTQNARGAPSSAEDIRHHRSRMHDTAVAAALGHHGLIDAYGSVSAGPDGVHPTAAGSVTWAALAHSFLFGTAP